MREGMEYDTATEFVKIHDETLLHDIVLILRHVKGVSASDIVKMDMDEVRKMALLVQEDLKQQKQGE